MEAFGVEDDVELAVDFDDIALAERAGDDFHGWSSSVAAGRRAALRPGPRFTLSGRNILILRPVRQRFSHASECAGRNAG